MSKTYRPTPNAPRLRRVPDSPHSSPTCPVRSLAFLLNPAPVAAHPLPLSLLSLYLSPLLALPPPAFTPRPISLLSPSGSPPSTRHPGVRGRESPQRSNQPQDPTQATPCPSPPPPCLTKCSQPPVLSSRPSRPSNSPKNRPKLSLASPTPSRGRAGERQLPLHPHPKSPATPDPPPVPVSLHNRASPVRHPGGRGRDPAPRAIPAHPATPPAQARHPIQLAPTPPLNPPLQRPSKPPEITSRVF